MCTSEIVFNYSTVRNAVERKEHAVFRKPLPAYNAKHLVVRFSNEGRLFSVTIFCDRRSEMSVLNSMDLYVGNISIPLFDRNNEVDTANIQ